jgi:hypothetical protein
MTVETYVEAVHRFARYAESQGDHRCRRRFPTLIRGWLAAMTDAGNSDGTRFNRFNGLKGVPQVGGRRWTAAEQPDRRHRAVQARAEGCPGRHRRPRPGAAPRLPRAAA